MPPWKEGQPHGAVSFTSWDRGGLPVFSQLSTVNMYCFPVRGKEEEINIEVKKQNYLLSRPIDVSCE